MEDILQVIEHFKTAVNSCYLEQVTLLEKYEYVFYITLQCLWDLVTVTMNTTEVD